MSNPQLENGYTRIANEIVEALVGVGLTGVEYQIVLLIMRKTYGYGKKEDWIALEQFVEFTGRTERGLLNAIFSLEARKIIVRRKEGRKVFYSFHKTFSEWGQLNDGSLNKSSVLKTKKQKESDKRLNTSSVKKKGERLNSRSKKTELPMNQPLNSSSDTKENTTKENIQKDAKASVANATDDFLPPEDMSDFVVTPEEPVQKGGFRAMFDWNDDQEFTRIMKQTCGFATLTNGKKPQENWARHILVRLAKILHEEFEKPKQESVDHVRTNMEEFCQLVQRARDADKFLWKRLTTLKTIYYELPTIFEMAKEPKRGSKSSSHLAL